MYSFARFPFVRFLEDIVQVESPMIRIHTCEFTHTNRVWSINQYKFVCDRSIVRKKIKILWHSTSQFADDTNSQMRVHTYKFVCDQLTNTNLYVIDQSYKKKIKILCWDSNHVPNIDVTPTAGWTQLFFYNINTVFKYDSHEWENDVTNCGTT